MKYYVLIMYNDGYRGEFLVKDVQVGNEFLEAIYIGMNQGDKQIMYKHESGNSIIALKDIRYVGLAISLEETNEKPAIN